MWMIVLLIFIFYCIPCSSFSIGATEGRNVMFGPAKVRTS